jgi:hypothetical protein
MSDPKLLYSYTTPTVIITDGSGNTISEPPIAADDTQLVRVVRVPESRLRDWQEVIAGVATALKGIGWDSTVDALVLMGEQIDKLLGRDRD